jgi:DNA polymerase-1
MRRVLLIDADILVYQVASAAEKPVDWGDDLWTLHSDMNEALPRLIGQINDIQERMRGNEMVFALTSTETNFRKTIYPKYKSNRKATRKPLVWKPLRDFLTATYTVFEKPHLEGDDCLGILATSKYAFTKEHGDDVEKVLVSIDKDFKTIPCHYWHLTNGESHISESQANYWFMFQTLTGDTTDGYPGCPGMGPKSAEKLLSAFDKHSEGFDLKGAWEAVLKAYKDKGLGEAVALQQARCARILRASDYDFKNKKPILWEPPQ